MIVLPEGGKIHFPGEIKDRTQAKSKGMKNEMRRESSPWVNKKGPLCQGGKKTNPQKKVGEDKEKQEGV